MKKRIEIDFEDEITNDLVLDVIERAMRKAVEAVAECAKIRKVTVDGNVFWLPDQQAKEQNATAKKEYPLHHEAPVVHRAPGLWG